jgi:hypothetical protein
VEVQEQEALQERMLPLEVLVCLVLQGQAVLMDQVVRVEALEQMVQVVLTAHMAPLDLVEQMVLQVHQALVEQMVQVVQVVPAEQLALLDEVVFLEVKYIG